MSDGFKESVMIALLPTTSDWCRIEVPHLTLVYAGEISDLSPTDQNALAKDASSIAMLSHALTLKVKGVEIFGDEEKVDVLTLETTPELQAMRNMVDKWNASEHSFNPHVTIGPAGAFKPTSSDVPHYLVFDRITVGWGNDYLTFRLTPY